MTQAFPPAPYPPAPVAPGRPRRVWDLVLTIVLLLLLVVLALYTSSFGLFLTMASDGCGGDAVCNTGLMTVGVLFAAAAPWIVLIATAIVSIVLLVRRRIAFWVSLVAAPIVVLTWFVGAFITMAGVPS